MLNWLIKRLSPVKRDTPRWRDLAASLEEFWDEQFTPLFENSANLRSIYAADELGQLRKISEFGTYYEQDMPAENRPVYFGMRKLEMLQKDTDVPVRMMMQRMGISGVEWLPLYALSNDLYGARFYTEKELEALGITIPGQDTPDVRRLDGSWKVGIATPIVLKRAGTYLTSRARLGVNLLDFMDSTIIPTLKDRIRRIKPLHIVFDGMQYWVHFDITVKASTGSSLSMLKLLNLTYPGNKRMDGSWKIGTDIVHPHKQLTGQWRLDGETRLGAYLTPGIVHATLVEQKISSSASIAKTIERPDAYLAARLGESLLRLDGSWHVGMNQVLTLTGQRHMNKVIQVEVATGISTGTVSASELQYPANPVRLAKVIQLDSYRRLNGSWKVGDTAGLAPCVDGGWKLKRTGFITESGGGHVEIKGDISARLMKLGYAYARLGEGMLKLDGSWQVSAYNKLDGRWKLKPGRRLHAPHLSATRWKLDGSWQLSFSGKKLDQSWRLGATTGPTCEAIMIIRKA